MSLDTDDIFFSLLYQPDEENQSAPKILQTKFAHYMVREGNPRKVIIPYYQAILSPYASIKVTVITSVQT